MNRSFHKGLNVANRNKERAQRVKDGLKKHRQRVIDRLKETKKEQWGESLQEIIGEEISQEELIAIEEMMENELIELNRRYLEEQAMSIVESERQISPTEDELVCPVCLKSYLYQQASVFFCSCGFKFDTKHNSITSRDFGSLLGAAFSKHNPECPNIPEFTVDTFDSDDILRISCSCCAMSDIVM
eukprot:TRINITY_DN8703_c1_g3_i1.p1 TRINITY_DN8703_c1_g3~~TRINITY_DN8703_c1_g3_i1.p1  ORF type:complete len:186 (-),score=37.95 TRINITY_DN8703_c1_g3_i1:149-706(-)